MNASTAKHTDASAPLAGLRVLDFGHTIMGPCAGLIFADLGADVVKIEPVDGDPTRHLPGFAGGFFPSLSRNKRSIAIDLKRPEGQAVIHRLAQTADVVLENFGAGTIQRLGCGWENLKTINPRLIYLAMKGFLAGPHEGRGALDEVVQMQSGLAYLTGPPGRPLRAGASVIDILGGVFGVVAVLAALNERNKTGVGQRVASSLFESAAFLMAPHIAGGIASGEPMRPFPIRKNAWGVYDVFDTADQGKQVFIGITSDAHWERFCRSFSLTDLATDERLTTNTRRVAAREWLIPELAKILVSMPLQEILERSEAAAIPYAPVGHPDELVHDPHLAANGGLIDVAWSALGRQVSACLPGLPMEFGDCRHRTVLRRQPPDISEHAKEVLVEAGYGADEIAQLFEAGIVRAIVEKQAEQKISRA
jgi:crotonobetainyl-CoA:carnitine CoA-transferase CaiB-like acyl-CoA transferase